jgi:hypothetical protein
MSEALLRQLRALGMRLALDPADHLLRVELALTAKALRRARAMSTCPTAEPLAALLANVLAGRTEPAAAAAAIAHSPLLAQQAAVAIGSQNQIGDIQFHDVAGGNILTLNLYLDGRSHPQQ